MQPGRSDATVSCLFKGGQWAAGCGAALLVLVLLLFWGLSATPLFDDGPFHGKPAPLPQREPAQTYRVLGGPRLVVYDPLPDEGAPTVALRTRRGDVRWCIKATGYDGCRVESLRFGRTVWLPFHIQPRVVGVVNWTYGSERMVWMLQLDGTLREYWYSW
jgi:hypothetical protein